LFLKSLSVCQIKAAKPPPKRYSNPGWWNDTCKSAIRKRNSALRKLNQLPKGSPLRASRKRSYYRLAALARKTILEQKTKWKEKILREGAQANFSNVWNIINKI
jgi:UDP-2,3-diacylglucosamine pyrophosphatase LpxH